MSQRHPYRDLDRFPTDTVTARSRWWRIVPVEHAGEPWWFSNSGDNRFDLNRHSGRGTCYLAQDLIGALVETVWRDVDPTGDPNVAPAIAASEVEGRRAVLITLGAKRTVADVTHAAGTGLHGGFGITSAIGTCDSYLRPQEWAGAWDAAGLDGVRYELARGNGTEALAVFGPAGAQHGAGEIHDLTAAALAEHGIEVLDAPELAELTVVDAPDTAADHIAP